MSYSLSRFPISIKTVLGIALFTQLSITAFGQQMPMKFGVLPATDAQMMTYEADTSAAAVVLCDFGKITVEELSSEYKCRYYRHRRVKILKESGYDYGDVELSYYSKDKRQQMGRIKANIFAPDGTMQTLSKKDFFEEKGEFRTRVKFAFPNVQVGSVIEYEYTVIHDGVYILPEWYFQEDIPVRWNELRFGFLDKFAYTYLFEGNPGMVKRVEDDVTYLEGESGQLTLKDKQFIMKNSVAMKAEPYITTMDDYKARIRFQLDSYVDGYGVKQQVLSSWKEIVKDLENQPFFGPQYMRKKFAKAANEELQPRLVGLSTEEEKVQAIYDFIAEKLEWNGRYHDFASKDLSKIWEEKKGGSADLNFMFISLLRQNGFEAYPLMTSTRDHGKMYEDYPILSQFDHTMVWTMIDGKERILDVPTKTRPIQEQIVMKLTIPEGYAIEELPQVTNLALPNNAGKFRYAVSKKDEQTIQLVATFKLNQYQFDPIEYPGLREMFDLVAEKYGEQIVLKKM